MPEKRKDLRPQLHRLATIDIGISGLAAMLVSSLAIRKWKEQSERLKPKYQDAEIANGCHPEIRANTCAG
jgi:hypothetical protein